MDTCNSLWMLTEQIWLNWFKAKTFEKDLREPFCNSTVKEPPKITKKRTQIISDNTKIKHVYVVDINTHFIFHSAT